MSRSRGKCVSLRCAAKSDAITLHLSRAGVEVEATIRVGRRACPSRYLEERRRGNDAARALVSDLEADLLRYYEHVAVACARWNKGHRDDELPVPTFAPELGWLGLEDGCNAASGSSMGVVKAPQPKPGFDRVSHESLTDVGWYRPRRGVLVKAWKTPTARVVQVAGYAEEWAGAHVRFYFASTR